MGGAYRRGALVVGAAFALSRLAAIRAGVRFDAGPLQAGFQVLELSELRDDLVRSLANLHAQPPLFNLFIGLVLRAPQGWEEPLLRVVYLAMGLALALAAYSILVRLGVAVPVAVAGTLVIALSPASILFENWAHYDYPVTLLLCLSVLALLRYEDGHRRRDVVVVLGLLGVLVLTRSTFQLIWYLAWAGVLLLHRRHADWKPIAVVAAVPLVAIVAVYANTLRVAGTFTSSTSLGASLAKITTFQLPEHERQAMVASGELSPLALVPPYSPVAAYAEVVPAAPVTGVPVLDDELKTFPDGAYWINFNNLKYAAVSNAYLDDALHTLRSRPDAYVQGLSTAFEIFFRPPSDFFTLEHNRKQIAGYNSFYNRVFQGVVASGEPVSGFPDVAQQYRQGPARTAWAWVALYAIAVLGGAAELWFGRRAPRFRPSQVVLGFLWSSVAYTMAVSNLVEVGENDRFRLYSDPLVVFLVAGLAVTWLQRRREATGRPAPP
ncbi:MAG: hypothetical protein KY450_01170 [Actinobacteria bacterium]|nr:hypothetical protein [Actinomycetota bacterium]